MKNQKIKKIVFLIMVLSVIAIGTFFRFWKLDSIPPGTQYDEAYYALDAINAFENGDYKIFYTGNNGREGLFINIQALFFKFFGVNDFTFKAVGAFFGALTLVGFFFLIKELRFAKLSILMGLFALSTSFWRLNFSRITFRAIMTPLVIVWVFYFFFKGIHHKKYGWIFVTISGLLTGVGMHTYISFRVVPLVLIIVVLAYLILEKKDFVKKQWRNALIFFIACVVSATPILFYFFTHQDDLVGRGNQVSIFNDPELPPLQSFGKSLTYHIGSFFVFGDPNQRHNNQSLPLIPATWAILLLFGFALSLKEIFQTFLKNKKTDLFDASVLAQGLFWVLMIPGVMSYEGIPHSLRIIGMIPAIFIFIAIPFDYLLRLYHKISLSENVSLKTWRYEITFISIIGTAFVVILSGIIQINSYFNDWAKNPETAEAFERKSHDFGILIRNIEIKENNYLVIPDYKKISPNRKESDMKPAELRGYPNIKNFSFWFPFEALKETSCENALFLFFEADEELVKQFEKKCPNLTAQTITPKNGLYEFWIMK